MYRNLLHFQSECGIVAATTNPPCNTRAAMRFAQISPSVAGLLRQTTPPVKSLLLLLALITGENLAAILSPWMAGRFSQILLQGNSIAATGYKEILLLWLAVLVVQSLLAYCSRIVSTKNSERMVADLRQVLYAHLQSLPISYFHARRHGETLSLLSYDTSLLGTFISSTLVGLFPHCATATGALLCMTVISPPLAALSLLLVPLFIFITRRLGRKARSLSHTLMQQYENLHSIAEENLSPIPLIKTFAREPQELERFCEGNEKLYSASVDYQKMQAKLAPSISLLSGALIIFFLLLTGDRVLAGTLSPGELISLLLYGLLLTRPISSLASVYGQGQRAVTSMHRLTATLSERAERHDIGKNLPALKGAITFTDVAFSYPGRPPLFSSLNLRIDPGETIAITGPNGSGKSTLVHLLIRLFTPDSGRILLDGIDIEDISLHSLRSQIGLVQQSVLLRNATVAENLLLGKPQATSAELERATRAAHAYEFISALPQGFSTLIGDRGVKLSGGQRQRLALARSLLKDPPILILDEATAMFDPEGESDFVRDNLLALREKTVLIITHRPATLALANRVYLLDQGTLSTLK